MRTQLLGGRQPSARRLLVHRAAFFLIFREAKSNTAKSFHSPVIAMVSMFRMSLGDFGDFYSAFDDTGYGLVARVSVGCLPAIFAVLLTCALASLARRGAQCTSLVHAFRATAHRPLGYRSRSSAVIAPSCSCANSLAYTSVRD